jgi:hypothetical protein
MGAAIAEETNIAHLLWFLFFCFFVLRRSSCTRALKRVPPPISHPGVHPGGCGLPPLMSAPAHQSLHVFLGTAVRGRPYQCLTSVHFSTADSNAVEAPNSWQEMAGKCKLKQFLLKGDPPMPTEARKNKNQPSAVRAYPDSA